MSGAGTTGSSLLRVAQACETLLAGFNSGKAAAVRSCLVSRQDAESLVQADDHLAASAFLTGKHSNNSKNKSVDGDLAGLSQQQRPSDVLLPLETAMANRRVRPSLLLPLWRGAGFAAGTVTTALLSSETSATVGAAIDRAVAEQYDANIRNMYEAGIVEKENEVKELFKAQRDHPSRAALTTDDDSSGLGGDVDTNTDAESTSDARSLAVAGTLKSALRIACTVTGKI